jgi:hypothetical protein
VSNSRSRVAILALVVAAVGAQMALAATAPVPATVTPKVARQDSAIAISFKTPIATGVTGKSVDFLEIQGSNKNPATFEKKTCLSSFNVDPAYGSAAGAEVSASVRPSSKWCKGTWGLQVLELKAPMCFVQRTCPDTTLDEFGNFQIEGTFKVK